MIILRVAVGFTGSFHTDWQKYEATTMNWRDRIAVDPDVVFGKPRIKGSRLSVEFLMGLFANGWSEQQVLESYPHLTREDLQTVFALAAEMIAEEGFVITGKLAA